MQRKLRHLVLEWIVDALLPCNTVENDAFVRLLKTACPRFAVPSAKYLRTCLMLDVYNKVKTSELQRSYCVFFDADLPFLVDLGI